MTKTLPPGSTLNPRGFGIDPGLDAVATKLPAVSQARTFNTREFEKGAGLVKKTPITPLYSTTPYIYLLSLACH